MVGYIYLYNTTIEDFNTLHSLGSEPLTSWDLPISTDWSDWSPSSALWGICTLLVALVNNFKTKQHLTVLFLESSI